MTKLETATQCVLGSDQIIIYKWMQTHLTS